MEKAQLLFKRILPALMAVFILLPLAYSAYVSFYLKARAASLDKEFEELSRAAPVKTEIKYNRFEETENYKKTLAKLDSIENQIKKNLPSINNFGSLADKIQDLALECGVEVAGLNIFNPAPDSSLDVYPMKIKLDCRSTYKAFKKFLWGLEKCSNTVLIEKINIGSRITDEKINYSYLLLGYIKNEK